MALAAAPATTLAIPPATAHLLNEYTLEQCGLCDGSRLSLALSPAQLSTPPSQLAGTQQQQQRLRSPQQYAASAATDVNLNTHYRSIADIWEDSHTSGQDAAPVCHSPSGHALLPAALLEDDEEEPRPVRATRTKNKKGPNNRARRSQSPPSVDQLSQKLRQDQLQHLCTNFRTKPCRNGPGCKFGRHCWFAHSPSELRKPSDPLPNNLPAVHKLERYSHRENKERQAD